MKYRKKPVVIEAMKWIGSNFVKIDEFITIPHETYPSQGIVKIPTLEGIMIASDGDYIIKGVQGEFYPCKANIFEATYVMECGLMNFGQATEAAKQGSKIARAGWNGKGQFVVLMPALYLPPYNTQGTDRKVNDRTAKHIGEDTPLDSQPYFAIFNAQGKWQPGWVPSTSDCLADDWTVVE